MSTLPAVLHYKSQFLNPSETFIYRIISNHKTYTPIVATTRIRAHTEGLLVRCPRGRADNFLNEMAIRFNYTPPIVYKAATDHNIHIIHAHFGLDGYRMLDIKRKRSYKLVVGFYGSDVGRLPYERGWRKRYKRLASEADRFIVPTNFMKSQLVELGFSEERISTIRFGIDLNHFSFNASVPSSRKLLMIGRFVEKKGFEYGLQALSLVRRDHPDIELDIIGDGERTDTLKRLCIELGIERSVHFLGSLSNERVRTLLPSYCAIVVPSIRAADGDVEGMPNTILEAMAAGIPVVTTQHAGIPELAEHDQTALVCRERNPDEIAHQILRLVSDDGLRANIIHAARKKIETEYDINLVVHQIETLYDELGT